MGKIIKKRIEYGGSSNSAENIKYDDTKNVKEAINEVDNLLGNTDISAIGDGTLTGGLDALNSNLKNKTLLEINANFTGNANDVVNNIVWCNDASNVPSGVGLLYSFSSYNIGQLFLDFQYKNIYIRYKNGNTNVWTDWTKI